MASWRDNIRQVEPYVPGEQPKNTNVIKLNTNENPYGPSPRVKAVQVISGSGGKRTGGRTGGVSWCGCITGICRCRFR